MPSRSLPRIRVKHFIPLAAHLVLASFTLLLIQKLINPSFASWWLIFTPLWIFHLFTSTCKFSIPAPNTPHDTQWSPLHTPLLLPLLLSFELLLCCYLVSKNSEDGSSSVTLEIVFLPLILLETLLLTDNLKMCLVLTPVDDDSISDEALWETLPHFAVFVSMIFILAATIFSVLKITGRVQVLDWWDLLVNLCIGEFFAFLVCGVWVNPYTPAATSAATAGIAAADVDSLAEGSSERPLLAGSSHGGGSGEEHDEEDGLNSPIITSSSSAAAADEIHCSQGPPDAGGYFIKGAVILFQILLCMHLQGEPDWARGMSMWTLFSPMLFLHAAASLSACVQLASDLLSRWQPGASLAMTAHDPCTFLTRGMRLVGWWFIEDEVRNARKTALHQSISISDLWAQAADLQHIKNMRKGELCEEVIRLQATIEEQGQVSKKHKLDLERIQQEKVLCRICFDRDISLVLMPCRHRVVCNECAAKCKQCPICRRVVDERMSVFDA